MAQPTLSRLIRGERTRITWVNLERVAHLVGRGQRSALWRVLESEDTRRILDAYRERLTTRIRQELDAKQDPVSGEFAYDRARSEEFIALREYVRKAFNPDIFLPLDRLMANRVLPERADLAYWRILGPLIPRYPGPFDFAQLECTWRELDAESLRQYVEAGVKREMILLGARPGDIAAADFAGDEIAQIRSELKTRPGT